ncbi:MAG TPA: hypothetical protein VK797_08770 [Tepidisphaeraceae bacterium]|jgi:hypothetical protein|nr:hypothetical protein [Tepidisphaeraceae bacterium]
MTDFNPLSGAILGSAEIQHQIGAQKQRQLRRAQAIQKNVAARDDEHEHQVESAEELHAINDGEQDPPQQQKKNPRHSRPGKDDDRPHIDLKA